MRIAPFAFHIMRFPLIDDCSLPCLFERFVPGRLHPDGRRYLPHLILRPLAVSPITPEGFRLLIVDRHHRIDSAMEGRAGVARLVFALSNLYVQNPPTQQGMLPDGNDPQAPSGAPQAFGVVQAISAWEMQRGVLPYEALYTELVLDVGIGTVGLRTSITAPSLAESIGAEQIVVGDAVMLTRSRIDILAFVA